MTLFDTHMHVPENPAEKAAFIREASDAGVRNLLACGCSLTDTEKCRAFSHSGEGLYFAAGICPGEAAAYNGSGKEFSEWSEDPNFSAIGEIGLDTYYDADSIDIQIVVLKKMLDFALEFSVPAVIHCRSKENDISTYETMYQLLKNYAGKGGRFVMHCYAGNTEYVKKFADLGAYFGVGGMLTFKRAENIRENVLLMPLNRILLETDSPYLAPVPHRGEKNRSALLPFVAEKLAEVLGKTPEEIALVTTDNAFRFIDRKRS